MKTAKLIGKFALCFLAIMTVGIALVHLLGDQPITWILVGGSGACIGFIAGYLDD